jgi:transcriptional regulator with XRE-family HTH domain
VTTGKDDLMIGQRIAHFRKLRRLTQAQLADRAHVSCSLLSKVEAGQRPATPVLVAALAPLLAVSVSELNGQPYFRNEPRPEPVHACIPALHGALARYDVPLDPIEPPRPLAQLRAVVGQVNHLRQVGNYAKLGMMLPALVDEATYVAFASTGAERPEVFRLLAAIYFATHSVAYKLGYDQLATIAEDRLVWAARQSADPLLVAVAHWARCTSFLATGAATDGAGYAAGLKLLGQTRTTLDDGLARADQTLLSVYGALHLREAILAARAMNSGTAWAHIEAAREFVARGAKDTNPQYMLTCGPVNARIVETAVAVELGDGTEAIARAESLVIPPEFPAVRAGHHFVDLARAYLWHGSRDGALKALLAAERYAPQQTRHHPMTHETLGVLIQQGRRCPDSLLGLADRVTRSRAARPST